MTDRARWAAKHLQYEFRDPSLLTRAVTHRSASRDNNERLEFLGDAFLNFTIANRLFERRRDDAEGDLSRARAALVNKSVLAAVGRRVALDGQLILGAGELRTGGAQRSSALADAVEALIGAVLIDGGHAAAAELVERLLRDEIDSLPAAAELKDPKTRLQEWLQSRGQGLPAYAVDAIDGKEHRRVFTVKCSVDVAAESAIGSGPSRRAAEQDAAARMLAALEGDAGR